MKKLLPVIAALLLIVVVLTGRLMPRAEEPGASEAPAAESLPAADGNEPGQQSTERGDSSADYDGQLRISELMSKNKAAVPGPNGEFPDWAELENVSGRELSLEGWGLSDREDTVRWRFSAGQKLAPGERLLVFFDGSGGPDFSLSPDETLFLFSPDGAVRDAAFCADGRADCSLIRLDGGGFAETPWISPGHENTAAGYEAWCEEHDTGSGLVINEVVVFNDSVRLSGASEPCDCVEIKNLSSEEISLAGCSLSDKKGEARWTFPDDCTLAPGEILLVCCRSEEDGVFIRALNTGFGLDAAGEQLYLRGGDGSLLDYAALHDIPRGGSMGRLEGQPGFFYFAECSPGEDNAGGERRISAMPTTAEPDGIFNGTDSVTVTLRASGEIRYTLDGSVPTEESPLYTEPLVLTETAIVRAAALEEGALISPTATFSYIVNENHTLPVLSLVIDDPSMFSTIWFRELRHYELPSNLALYDGEHSFNRACGLSMKGYTSLELPKKSLGVSFGGSYGGNLDCDVFGNGVTEFSSLSIRAGEDYALSVFRNELFQRLCLEAGDACLTQASKFCILYVNGSYYGVYCLKEDLTKQYYASHAGVSRDSVSSCKCPVDPKSDFYTEVIDYIYNHDMSDPDNYRTVCERVDIDSLIDWFLLEGYSANRDLTGNARLYRSTENGNRWVCCFYDLDAAFWYPDFCFAIFMKESSGESNLLPPLIRELAKNPDFRERALRRYSELIDGVLSTDHVLALIDEFQAGLEPEMARERSRWVLVGESWYRWVDEMRSFLTDNDWERFSIDRICEFLEVGPEERAEIFGR